MERIILWGTGKIANEILSECLTLSEYEILGIIDNDTCKQGTLFYGIRVYAPDILLEYEKVIDRIVILTKYYKEIQEQISKLNESLLEKMENECYFYKQSLIKRYKNSKDEQIQDIIDYLNNNDLDVFNYEWAKKYNHINKKVYRHEESGLYFVKHNGIDMFFSRKYKNEKEVMAYYQSILMEQDEKSPHRYLDDSFEVKDGDVVVDVGVAEGNFSIDIIKKAKRIYLIEADPLWVEALKYTFADYMDKVVFIEKYLTDYNEGKLASLDKVVSEKINFIKMDIEGCEYDALVGAREVIRASEDIKMAICCYHSDFDQVLIEDELDKQGFKYYTTDGYMYYPDKVKQTTVSIKLHRGIIRAYR